MMKSDTARSCERHDRTPNAGGTANRSRFASSDVCHHAARIRGRWRLPTCADPSAIRKHFPEPVQRLGCGQMRPISCRLPRSIRQTSLAVSNNRWRPELRAQHLLKFALHLGFEVRPDLVDVAKLGERPATIGAEMIDARAPNRCPWSLSSPWRPRDGSP